MRGGGGGGWRGGRVDTIILLAPACLLFGIFVVYPLVASVALSFYDWDGIGPKTWVGIANFAELFADDREDTVGVRTGHIKELLPAGAEAQPPHAAAAQRDE